MRSDAGRAVPSSSPAEALLVRGDPLYRRYQCVPMVLGDVGSEHEARRGSLRRVDDGDELLDVLEQAGVGDAARSAEPD